MKRCKARFPQSRARCAAAALALAVVAGVGFTAVRAHRRAARLRKRTTATRRPVSTTERAIYEIHRKLSGAMKVAMRVKLRGKPLDVAALKLALRTLQARHRVLQARLEEVAPATSPSTLSDMDLVVDEAVTIPVSTFVRHDDATWLETWTRHQKSAPSPEECLMEVLVFAPSSSGGTESATLDSDGSGVGAGVGATDVDTDVVLVCNHAFCDGISLSWVAHELLLVLGDGAELAPLPLPPAIETCAHRSIGNAFMRMFAMVKLGMTMGKPTPCAMFPVSDKSIPFLELHATADTVTLYADLDVTNTAALSAACRSHGVTITAAVWAALVQAVEVLVSEAHDLDDMDERGAPLPIRVHCGADTRRRYVPALAPNLLSYHVAGVPTPKVVFGDEEGEALRSPAGLWTLAARAKSLWTQALQKGLTNAFCLVLGRMYSAALQLTDYMPRTHSGTSSVSSWGVLPFKQQYGDWKLVDARPSVNMAYFRTPITLASTVNGRLTVTFHAPSQAFSDESLTRLRDEFLRRLQSMAGAS